MSRQSQGWRYSSSDIVDKALSVCIEQVIMTIDGRSPSNVLIFCLLPIVCSFRPDKLVMHQSMPRTHKNIKKKISFSQEEEKGLDDYSLSFDELSQEKGLDGFSHSLEEVWTIEIEPLPLTTDGDPITQTKHIRRIRQTKAIYEVPMRLLACGDRKCGYFATLFATDSFADAQSRTSRIQLHELAVKAFPAMLDYIEGNPTSKLTITTESAIALYHLGGYFDNKALRSEAEQFWRKDVTEQPYEKIHIYYEHARCFQEDTVMDALKDLMNLFVRSLTI